MMQFDIKLEGWDELEKDFRALPEVAQEKAIKPAIKQAALLVKKTAQSLVPKDTGRLRKHIQVVMVRTSKGKPVVALVGIPKKTKIMQELKNKGKKPFYWLFLERGTKKMRARPYLRPALKRHENQVGQLVKHSIESFLPTYYKRGRIGGF